MAGIKLARRVIGAVIAAIGVSLWIADIMLTFTLPYSEYGNDALVAMVPISGAVLVAGGLLAGLWN
ncbi:SepZ protein [Sulfuracidifex metallicus]|uniref:SepZ protein n=1 Tax=Sulfuracidifex metallicus DSM 6482 = JCM 9184 TaxID=523847 RepID=A0A6A9QFN8_SULME|nr:SepZ protein [Sulfuracidifex metallicus]MUN27896.1 SepZ protein [Sulfuracidifex metallicus DSM 6482 = JCM 9184]